MARMHARSGGQRYIGPKDGAAVTSPSPWCRVKAWARPRRHSRKAGPKTSDRQDQPADLERGRKKRGAFGKGQTETTVTRGGKHTMQLVLATRCTSAHRGDSKKTRHVKE